MHESALVRSSVSDAVPLVPRHSRWNVLVHFRAFSEPTLLWAKGVLYPHVGGTETHRAQNVNALSLARVTLAHSQVARSLCPVIGQLHHLALGCLTLTQRCTLGVP